MKRQHIASMVIGSAAICVVGMALAAQDKYTLPLGLRGFIFNRFTENWSEFAAAAVLGSLPLMVVFLLTQRYLVSGRARGADKG